MIDPQPVASPFTPLPRGPFGAVMADPPWSFKTWSQRGLETNRSIERRYKTLGTYDTLESLPVADVVAEDAALLMWVVDSHLDQGMYLGRAWGFEYKTIAFIWVKTKLSDPAQPRMGMGYWTRKQAEVCLLFTRGRPARLDKGVPQVIMGPRREHSRKPDEAYHRARRLVGGPYLELFSREERAGWTTWGNETGKFTPAPRERRRVICP